MELPNGQWNFAKPHSLFSTRLSAGQMSSSSPPNVSTMKPEIGIEALQEQADWALYETLQLVKQAQAKRLKDQGAAELEALYAAPTVEHPLGPNA